MKLHLPTSLRKALILALSAVSVGVSSSAYAASRSDQLTRATYCDFGDNKGQYAVHGVNDLLQHLRDTQGIRLTYLTEGKADYVWDSNQPLINYDSRVDAGAAAGIGYNFIATVQHNGVANPTFTASTIGDDKAIHYAGIEYRSSTNNQFLLVPGIDYKVTRLSKIITDVTGSGVYTGSYDALKGQTWYRSGSGTMYKVSPEKATERESGAYAYCIGGIMQITSAGLNAKEGQVDVRGLVDDSGSVVINKNNWWKLENINDANPLPFVIQAGDSGSPTWIYDSESGSYLYAGAMQSGEGVFFSQARYAGQWTEAVMTYFNRNVSMPESSTVHIGAANTPGVERYDATNNVTSHPYLGQITTSGGEVLQTYIGVKYDAHTWKDLNAVQNTEHWYAYGNGYLNTGSVSYADLFETQDLVFKGDGGQTYRIELDDDVDLGLGYMRFANNDGSPEKINYYLANQGSENNRLDTAGFIVDAGIDVHMSLNGTQNYAREWRKIGDGNLHISGNGDNYDVLLNLGGSGSTYLERTNGYAAYNVLANNGTTVVVKDQNQIKRDFTFGYGGALLDMNGVSMTWNNSNQPDADGFTIHALTDEAVISNLNKGTVTKLTWTQGGQREYLGSFVDKEDGGVFQFIYNAEAENSRLVLHSIYTDLGNAAPVGEEKGGIIVQNGTLALQGTNTLHAPGSLGVNFSNARYFSGDDWHYADSKTAVTVEGGTFELGHHARLTGDVTVKNGGIFLMREGVTHQYEYVEGGYTQMDTDEIAAYFGLKGNVNIASGGTMRIAFNDNADTRLTYRYNISGEGSLEIDPGILGGEVVLAGNNMGHTGSKLVRRGGLLVDNLGALGDTAAENTKWKLMDSGFLVLNSSFSGMEQEKVLDLIHKDSSGILALTEGTERAYDLSGHTSLIIGAYKDTEVHYGTSTQTLAAQADETGKKSWRLGGGGGELVVDFILNETDNERGTDLVLGADYAKGVVYLTNNENNFKGTIIFKGGVTLKYDDERALGDASFAVNYTNRIATPGGLGKIRNDSNGVLLVDRIQGEDLNLGEYKNLAIGSQSDAVYTGNITVAVNEAYHFGGSTGKLTVVNALAVNGRNDLDVDGQTFSGGEIRLEAATSISGDVTVRGCNPGKASQTIEDSGDIILGLGVSNAIKSANSVTLYRGGYLDMSGTTQEIRDLGMAAGSRVFNSSADKSELTVSMTKNLTWAGAMDAEKVRVGGAYTLTMSGTSAYDELRIGSGTQVKLDGDNTLSKFGTTYIEKGATLDANRKSTWGDIYVEGRLIANNAAFSGVVTLDGGTVNLTGGSLSNTSTLISNGGRVEGKQAKISGMAFFMKNETVFSLADQYAIDDTYYPSIAGTVSISQGATLTFEDGGLPFLGQAGSWKYSISSAEFNVAETYEDEHGKITKEEKGTLKIASKWVYLNGGDQQFGGTVKVANSELNLSAEKGTKTFDNLTNQGTTRLTNNSNGKPASWIFHELVGGGRVQAESANWVRLDGASTFNGTFAMQGGGTLEIAHQQALELATLSLDGSSILAVGANVASVNQLQGSGSIRAGYIGGTGSTKVSTLQLVGTGVSTFSGSVVSSADYGINIQMVGSGTQNFSGANIKTQDINVLSGTLAFNHASDAPVVYGDVSISQGGNLDFGSKALSLADGQALRITAGTDGEATFKGNLDFAGGKVVFDSSILSVNAAVFKLDGAAMYHEGTSSLVVNFTNEDVLQNGTYKLSTGNWSAVKGSISSDSLIYHSATFSADNTSLSVEIGDRTDIQVWNGENGKSGWNDQTFGNETNNLTQGSTAVFNDDAASANVSITSNVEVKELVFDNDENTYRLVTGAGAGVQADKLRQVGDSSTELTGNFHAAAADVEAGTLSLGRGSSVDTVNVAESATVVLKDADRQPETISGDGTVRVDWGAENTQALNIGRIGVVEVESGHVDMTGQDSVSMNVLHVKENTSFGVTAQAGNFADKAIVDKDGRLEASISAFATSGLVTELSGAGTVSLTNSREVDLGDHEVSGGRVDASAFTGTLELGNGEQKMRFRSSNVTGLGQGATIEVADKSQYWVTDNNCVVNANLLLHGDSGAAKGNSWKNEGFGAVRGAKVVNGDVIIDGNAMLSGNDQKNITFNGAVKSYNDSGEDTMTLGCYYSNGAMTYTFAEGSDASGLDNIVLRRSGGAGTGQGSILNIESDKGLARNVQFYAGTTDGAQVNINAAATADTLKSAAGDGVVNIAEGKSLELTRGQVYGGSIHLGDGVAVTAAEGQVATVQDRVTYGVDGAASATISGTGATRMENAAIDLAEGSRLVMENITLSTNSTVTDETAAAALAAKSLKLEAKVGENLMRRESVAARMQPLTYGLDMPQPKMAAAAADDVVSFTLQNVSGIAMEGEQLLISMVGSNGAFDSYDWVGISLAENGTFDDNLAVTLLYTDAEGAQRSVNGVYTLEDAETAALAAAEPHGMVYFHLAGAAGVPEPASSTLSLLALAALAARRRRKG